MIVPDVNVLVRAFRADDPRHEPYARWLTDVVHGSEEMGLVDTVVAGLVRIVSNRRIFPEPAPVPVVMAFVGQLRGAARVRWLGGGEPVWSALDELVAHDPLLGGDAVPDAFIAATAIAHGARLATADRGFARYPGLRWFDPAA